MSAFLDVQAKRLYLEGSVPHTSNPVSAHSTPSQSLTTAPMRSSLTKPEDAQATQRRSSGSLSPTATPPLRSQGKATPAPPASAPGTAPESKAPPQLLHPESKRTALSAPNPAARSRSASASSADSDEDFVYMLDSVKTTEEAVARIRAVQQPKERSLTSFFANGRGSSMTNIADMVDAAPLKMAKKTPPPSRKMRGGLPATMEEFYECPRYTVSLTAAREAVFSDALSGFHSYVVREREQRERLRELQQQQQQHTTHRHNHPHRGTLGVAAHRSDSRAEDKGSSGNHTVLSFTSGATAEWNTALAAAAAGGEASSAARSVPTAPSTSAAPGPSAPSGNEVEPPTAHPASVPAATETSTDAASTPMKSSGTVSTSSVAGPSIASPLLTDDAAAEDPQHLSASYMFIKRSRDTEAMSPVSSPRAVTQQPDFAKTPLALDDDDAVAVAGSADAHFDPTNATAPLAAPPSSTPLAPPGTTTATAAAAAPGPQSAAKLEAMQLQTLLQERIYQRARVPLVFRCRYALDFAETAEEHKQRVQMRDRVLRHNERLMGPDGMTPELRQRIRERYADPNAIPAEWPYVWEQFERDIPRETLFVADVPYHNADDALAAIMSYVEYCYDRGQQHIKERTERVLAAAKSEPERDATAAGPAEAARRRKDRESAASPPPPPAQAAKPRGFFESLLSASSAAIKGAVVTVRSSLPDFVGDPLLTLSGLDPALYHASLLFPTDPKARSEKIFAAVREVVLASQQSFMGFPYQLLCEQVGTERLGLALEALENEEYDDYEDEEADEEEDWVARGEGKGEHSTGTAAAAVAVPPSTSTPDPAENSQSGKRKKPARPNLTLDASAPIPIHRSDSVDGDTGHESLRSSMPNSRVVRIYQSFSSPTMLTDNPDSRRRRGRMSHVIDEWNVSSSSSSRTSSVAPSEAIGTPATPGLTVEGGPGSAAPEAPADGAVAAAALEGKRADTPQSTPRRPPPLNSLLTDSPAPPAPESDAAAAPPAANPHPRASRAEQRRRERRERRRRRRSQLPLLVGEPRPYEFAAFLDILRARVAAKVAKEEKRERDRQRRERIQRMVERQREQWHSQPGSRAASSNSLDTLGKATKDTAAAPPAAGAGSAVSSRPRSKPPAKAPSPFREDVEGSAYLLQTQSPATAPLTRSLSGSFARSAMAPETRGMRICLLYDEQRNVPVVVVNKVFRLFTMPGLRGLTSSEEEDQEENAAVTNTANSKETAAAVAGERSRSARSDDVDRSRPPMPKRGSAERSLLLLIQVQFSLFTKEEAEVRWKWWKV